MCNCVPRCWWRTRLVSPSCDSVCHTAGLLAARWGTALVSYGCESTQLSNRDLYPTFVRTTGTYLELSRFMNSIIQYWKWESVNIVTMVNSSDVWLEMADELNRNLDLPIDNKQHWSVDLANDAFLTDMQAQTLNYRSLLDITMDVTRNTTAYNAFMKELETTLRFDGGGCPQGHYE
ncbi:hypothetical protein BaRGS_00039614, partial [Batillaria attramentaria]